jgi:acyl-CoA reductase-like NAD-dependent aldehyde dehydrogenase
VPGARREEPARRHARTPTSTWPVEGTLFSGFGTAGQRCTSLGTAIVHESIHDEFVRRLTAAVEAAAIGDPTQDVCTAR